ncbi:MAG TPA: hypothetical protein EYH19_02670 [Desulfocapsa sulfexigens]|nr:hypothetical protein [Desulfocapsa sulfexigens]
MDLIEYDPARSVGIFSFGPRIIATAADLEQMEILARSSRVEEYQTLLEADAKQVDEIVDSLKLAAEASGENVESALTVRSAAKRSFNNLFLRV